MAKENLLNISAFATFARTTKDTLLHYDRIGLVKPVVRSDAGFRSYTVAQLAIVNVIRTYQEMGFTLNEIKSLLDERNPENIYHTFEGQLKLMDKKIRDLQQSKELFVTLYGYITDGLEVDETQIEVRYLESLPIIRGQQNVYHAKRDDYDALYDFHVEATEKYPDLNLNYPVWGMFSRNRIEQNECMYPDYYFMYHPQGEEKREAGDYVIGYTRGGYGETQDLYQRLLAYIKEHDYEISGICFEEYPLNELTTTDQHNYLIRIMLPVKRKP